MFYLSISIKIKEQIKVNILRIEDNYVISEPINSKRVDGNDV